MRRVLIVEDALELGRLLQAALKTLPFPIDSVVVPSAEEAMLDARLRPADLLVTDIRLPGMGGLDLIQKLRDRSPKTRYIVITALAEDEYRIRARQLGVRAYFQKPMELADFLTAVTAALELQESEYIVSDDQLKGSPAAIKVEEPPPPLSTAELLANLRRDLEAQAVILLGDHGRISGQAGDFPDPSLEEKWIPALLAAHSTHSRLAGMMEQKFPKSMQLFSGSQFDLVLTPIGDFALVLVLGVGKIDSQIAQYHADILKAQQSLMNALERQGYLQASNENRRDEEMDMQPEAGLDNLDQLAELLNNRAEFVREEEVKTFWQQTDENLEVTSHILPDAISFEQARQLGLLTDDE